MYVKNKPKSYKNLNIKAGKVIKKIDNLRGFWQKYCEFLSWTQFFLREFLEHKI